MSHNTRSRSNYFTTHSRDTAHSERSNMAPQICAALNDPSLITAFRNIISDKVMEAIGVMENQLRSCVDERIEQLHGDSRKLRTIMIARWI